jgi:hypothetical protein
VRVVALAVDGIVVGANWGQGRPVLVALGVVCGVILGRSLITEP